MPGVLSPEVFEVIGEPIKGLAKLIEEPIKITSRRALLKALTEPHLAREAHGVGRQQGGEAAVVRAPQEERLAAFPQVRAGQPRHQRGIGARVRRWVAPQSHLQVAHQEGLEFFASGFKPKHPKSATRAQVWRWVAPQSHLQIAHQKVLCFLFRVDAPNPKTPKPKDTPQAAHLEEHSAHPVQPHHLQARQDN